MKVYRLCGAGSRLAARQWAARVADHYHSASEHGIIGRRIDTVVADRFRRRHRNRAGAVPQEPRQAREEGDAGWRR